MNEFLLIASLLISFGMALLFFYYFGKSGCIVWVTLCTVFANIEVTILVNAFGIEQTLGNTLFASSFLATDFLSEFYSKEDAGKGVKLGIAGAVVFIIFSSMWQLYTPSENDWAMQSIKTLFSNTPRILIASLSAYAISEVLDVNLYHAIWKYTENKTSSRETFLWLRNNGATLTAQAVNAIVFNAGAFWGMYDSKTLFSITLASYLIYIATSLLDTPFLYTARILHKRKNSKQNNGII